MSFRKILLKSKKVIGQLIKQRNIQLQNEFHQKFNDRRCYQQINKDNKSTSCNAKLFQRYGLFKVLPESSFRGFASLMRRNATMRLMSSRGQAFGRGSLFAFVGISMVGSGIDSVSELIQPVKTNSYEEFCSKIRKSFKKSNQPLKSVVANHVSGYEFTKTPLGHGCNGVIFAARVKDERATSNQEGEILKKDDGLEVNKQTEVSSTSNAVADEMTSKDVYPIAIKMVFNFAASSNSNAICSAFERELIPLTGQMSKVNPKRKNYVIKHPNIVDMYTKFVDSEYPCVDYIKQHHPACLPSSLNPDLGLGHNMTLFLAMKRYDMNLKEYLKDFGVQSERVAMVMLAQLLEGVTFLVSQGIAHRDLKSNNILIEIENGNTCRLIITDFGCCLAQSDRSLCLSYPSSYVDRGGNSALMAPEIKTAVPGDNTTISYWKSDAWTVGTIAYEIAGLPNPFSTSQNAPTNCLDSGKYQDSDLPKFVNGKHRLVEMVSKLLLRWNPHDRICAEVGANIIHLFLWQPQYWKRSSWGTGHVIPTSEHVVDWLGMVYAESRLKHIMSENDDITESDLCSTFLQRIDLGMIMEAVTISQQYIVNEFLEYSHSPSKL